MKPGQATTLGSRTGQVTSDGPQTASSLREAALSGASRYDPDEVSRARAVIRLNLACVVAWTVINCAGAWRLHNARPAGVAAAGLAMAGTFTWALRQISGGRMPSGVATYTISGLLLLLVMGLFVPELSLMFRTLPRGHVLFPGNENRRPAHGRAPGMRP
jgi:hypothetical protein